ncbi:MULTISPECIES: DinB family protein [Capnocytophaga]|uniref:DinB family protein n=3 Tax=Capnocytophaga TaxID=1016 RepID=A0A0B7HBF3_9FLAO|nr:MULTISPECIES: DinB family protein [Capnocytophaga]MDO5106544.1 DinB family protein [Capnocytophaga sp.]CEN35242.1 DinB family protein [Capnocytophaga cynodegmi]
MQNFIITSDEWFVEWEENRRLTRKVIEAFPEKELFSYSIGGMRTFAELVGELIQLAVEGTQQLAENKPFPLDRNKRDFGKTKAELLNSWDKATEQIAENWKKIPQEMFRQRINIYGKLDFMGWKDLLYFYENEIHHRGQGYVYLRSLGIEPPSFVDRS